MKDFKANRRRVNLIFIVIILIHLIIYYLIRQTLLPQEVVIFSILIVASYLYSEYLRLYKIKNFDEVIQKEKEVVKAEKNYEKINKRNLTKLELEAEKFLLQSPKDDLQKIRRGGNFDSMLGIGYFFVIFTPGYFIDFDYTFIFLIFYSLFQWTIFYGLVTTELYEFSEVDKHY